MHYKRGGTTQQCAGTGFFYNNNGRNKQHMFLENRLSLLLLASPRFLVRETRSRLSGPRGNTNFYDPDCLRTNIHTQREGSTTTYNQKGRDRLPRRPVTQSPRPLSLSPFSSRRDIQPRGALRRWRGSIPAMVSARSPPPFTATGAARSVLHADRRAALGTGGRGRKRGRVVAGSLALLGLSDLPYPPGLCGTVPNTPFPRTRSPRLLCMASFSRGFLARCG